MKKETIEKLRAAFEQHAYEHDSTEFWLARDLQSLLGYGKWENFTNAIEKAKVSCRNSGYPVERHFPEVRKMVTLGQGLKREVDDVMLTRYACYLIAQNGDPRKERISFAQSYFALQTRKLELIEQRIELIERINARKKLVAVETELSKLIFERGVDEQGFARIRSKGDEALFGGFKTAKMKQKLGMPSYRALADFLPTITITAKNLATEITNFNVQAESLQGEPMITDEHVKNNKDVRALLGKSGIEPENLPIAEDLKKLERRTIEEERQIAQQM